MMITVKSVLSDHAWVKKVVFEKCMILDQVHGLLRWSLNTGGHKSTVLLTWFSECVVYVAPLLKILATGLHNNF